MEDRNLCCEHLSDIYEVMKVFSAMWADHNAANDQTHIKRTLGGAQSTKPKHKLGFSRLIFSMFKKRLFSFSLL